MSFYGDIYVPPRLFHFDKVYNNRTEMDISALVDGVNENCFVLVNYRANGTTYAENYQKDEENYCLNDKNGLMRGYDKTVWQKRIYNDKPMYILFTELHGIIPTFNVSEPTYYVIKDDDQILEYHITTTDINGNLVDQIGNINNHNEQKTKILLTGMLLEE